MISANQIKYIKSLGQIKFRKQHNEFVVEGPKLVDELFKSSFKVNSIFALEDWMEAHPEIESEKVSPKELSRISNLKNPNQVLAVVEIPEKKAIEKDTYSDLVLMLDGINDPGNMGTILRIADWFGINQIICSENTVDIYNPKVVQASMGSLFRMQVNYENLVEVLKGVPRGTPVYGTYMKGKPINELKNKNGILIIGSESHGISLPVNKYVSELITIPPFNENTSHAESLNAGIAAAIACYEIRKQ